MYFALLAIISLAFALFAWNNFKQALFLLAGILPIYLLRIAVGPFPTTLLEIFILITAIIWLIKYRPSWKEIKKLPWLPPAFLFIVAATIGIFVAPDQISALGIWKAYFIEPVILAVIFSTTLTKNDWSVVFRAFGITAAVLSLFAILQYVTGLGIPTPWDIELRATSIFDYPNALGLFLVPIVAYGGMRILQAITPSTSPLKRGSKAYSVPLLFKEGLGVVTRGTRAFWIGIITLSFIGILLAQTEAAFVALPAALLMGLWFTDHSKQMKVSITIITLTIATLLFALVPTVQEKLLLQDYSGQVRLSQWSETFKLVNMSPVFGAGLNGYPIALETIHDPSLYEIFQYPHNLFLNIWAELGLLGLVAFFWLAWLTLKYLLHSDLRSSSLPIFTALLAMTIHGFVDVPYFKNDLSILTWLLIAGFFATNLIAKAPHSNK